MNEHVELWLRSMSSWTVGRKGAFVDDLEALSAGGVIDDYEVNMWNDHVPVDGVHDLTPREETVRRRVETIHEWADENDYDLPAFSQSTKVRGFDGPSYDATVLPLAVLVGFEDGDLQWMAPYTDETEDEHVTVQDRLDELAARPPETGESADYRSVEAE